METAIAVGDLVDTTPRVPEKALADLFWDRSEGDIFQRVVSFLADAHKLVAENSQIDDLENPKSRKPIIREILLKVTPASLRDLVTSHVKREQLKSESFSLAELHDVLLKFASEEQRMFDAVKNVRSQSPRVSPVRDDESKRARGDEDADEEKPPPRGRMLRSASADQAGKDKGSDGRGNGRGGGRGSGSAPGPNPNQQPRGSGGGRGGHGYQRNDHSSGRGRGAEEIHRDAGYRDVEDPALVQRQIDLLPRGWTRTLSPEGSRKVRFVNPGGVIFYRHPVTQEEPLLKHKSPVQTVVDGTSNNLSTDPTDVVEPEMEIPHDENPAGQQDEAKVDRSPYAYPDEDAVDYGEETPEEETKDDTSVPPAIRRSPGLEVEKDTQHACEFCSGFDHVWKKCPSMPARKRRARAHHMGLIVPPEGVALTAPTGEKKKGRKRQAKAVASVEKSAVRPPSSPPRMRAVESKHVVVPPHPRTPSPARNRTPSPVRRGEVVTPPTTPEKEAERYHVERLAKDKIRKLCRRRDGKTLLQLEGVLEVPYCADSGAALNIIPQSMVDELVKVRPQVVVLPTSRHKKKAIGPDGQEIMLLGRVLLSVIIYTAAGPVKVPGAVECHVTQDGDEFLVSDGTLKQIGIDISRLLEQVAEKQRLDEGDDIIP
ncbi:hypothetical protein As57867_002446, partial [Aphanomyces stellatus]